jgi:hypothetical protein
MPSKTPKQERTMRAAKHDPAFASKMGIPQSVASDFVAADQQKKGSYTVPQMCGGGKVLKSWSK